MIEVSRESSHEQIVLANNMHKIDLKRKTSEDTTAASVLLSFDCKSNQNSKRHRHDGSSSSTETRELSTITREYQSQEERDCLENTRESSSVSFSNSVHSLDRRLRTNSLEGTSRAESHEFESAIALASLAHHIPTNISTKSGATHRRHTFPSSKDDVYASPHHEHRPSFHHGYNEIMELPFMHPHEASRFYTAYSYRGYVPHPQVVPRHNIHHHPRYERQPQQHRWVCDFCGQGSFVSYDDAFHHERMCPHNPKVVAKHTACGVLSQPSSDHYLYARSHSMTSVSSSGSNLKSSIGSSDMTTESSPIDQDESKFFSGVTALAVPSADPEWLSELNCYIRMNCIQAFSAEQDDVLKSSKRGRISLKQVGIRCAFCVGEDIEERAMSAVSYPVSSSGIYESVKRWLKIHLPLCKCIPSDVRDKINQLEKANHVPTTRQYWVDSAKALGIEDTHGGLRFTHEINDERNAEKASEKLLLSRCQTKSTLKPAKDENIVGSSPIGKYIVFPEDETIITPFLYALLRQVETCEFTDADRYIARSRCPKGFHGFQCRHCSGHAGLGKYFPTSPKALSTNSTSQNIFSHVLKCRKCPEEVKDKLKSLKNEKGHWTRRTTGWRQKFFEDVWKRLHGDLDSIQLED